MKRRARRRVLILCTNQSRASHVLLYMGLSHENCKLVIVKPLSNPGYTPQRHYQCIPCGCFIKMYFVAAFPSTPSQEVCSQPYAPWQLFHRFLRFFPIYTKPTFKCILCLLIFGCKTNICLQQIKFNWTHLVSNM